MGSGTEAPARETLYKGLTETPYGVELANSLYKSHLEGLNPSDLETLRKAGNAQTDIYMRQGKRQLGSNLAEERERLKEGLYSSGGIIPTGALISGMSKLQRGTNESMNALTDKYALAKTQLEKDITDRQISAKDLALQRLFQLYGFSGDMTNSMNQYNMQKYQIDKENEFGWGDVLGSILGTAGSVGSAFIKRGKS